MHYQIKLLWGDWGRMDTCLCMAESHWCLPETIMTLLIGYTPLQNNKFKKNMNWRKGNFVHNWHVCIYINFEIICKPLKFINESSIVSDYKDWVKICFLFKIFTYLFISSFCGTTKVHIILISSVQPQWFNIYIHKNLKIDLHINRKCS